MKRYLSAVFIVLLAATASEAAENAAGRLTGAWVPPDIGPVSGGMIYAFNTNSGPPPRQDRSLRLPDAIAVTDADGRFSLELDEGTYYLSTRKQYQGETPGPPQEGDLYGLVRDQHGNLSAFAVKSGRTTDIGVVQRATVFKPRAAALPVGAIGISGTIKTADGKPMADAIVLVYDNPQIRDKPSYASHKTGSDGKYTVLVDRKGTYFAAVHAANGTGRPQDGDPYGVYGGETAAPIRVGKNRITTGINILVGPFVPKRPDS